MGHTHTQILTQDADMERHLEKQQQGQIKPPHRPTHVVLRIAERDIAKGQSGNTLVHRAFHLWFSNTLISCI